MTTIINPRRGQVWQAVYGALASLVTYLVPLLLFIADIALGGTLQGMYLSTLQTYLMGSLVHGLWQPPVASRLVGLSCYFAFCVLFWGGPAVFLAPLLPVLVVSWHLNSLILRRPLLILLCLTIVAGLVQAFTLLPQESCIAIWQVTWHKIIVNIGACCVLYGLWGSRLKRG